MATKPILYGSWAEKRAKVPAVVNALAGLGHLFIAKGWRVNLFKECIFIAYKMVFLSKNSRVLFQNPDDIATFLDQALVSEEKISLVKGSVEYDLYY